MPIPPNMKPKQPLKGDKELLYEPPTITPPLPPEILNREAWLTNAAKLVEPIFKGFTLKPYRLTCGWPSRNGTGRKKRVVGECHSIESSKGGVHEIFISPVLEESLEVLGTVCHEVAHVVAGIDAKHGARFVKVCKHVGLTKGKATEVMPGDALNLRLAKVVGKLGKYPHSALVGVRKPARPGAGGISLTCPMCACLVRISRKWLDMAGCPTCGCGAKMTKPDDDGDDDAD
jgi:hypothetical protein